MPLKSLLMLAICFSKILCHQRCMKMHCLQNRVSSFFLVFAKLKSKTSLLWCFHTIKCKWVSMCISDHHKIVKMVFCLWGSSHHGGGEFTFLSVLWLGEERCVIVFIYFRISLKWKSLAIIVLITSNSRLYHSCQFYNAAVFSTVWNLYIIWPFHGQ